MKNRCRDFIIGALSGVFISQTVFVFANTEYKIEPNQFEVQVNGRHIDIEGYNINDSTYFKLRDLGKYLGLDVNFKEGVIMINTGRDTVVTNITPEIGFYNKVKGKWDDYSYDIILMHENEKYIECFALHCIGINYDVKLPISLPTDGDYCYAYDSSIEKEVSPKIKYYMINGTGYIKYSDFEKHIKPVIDKMLDERGIVKGSLE